MRLPPGVPAFAAIAYKLFGQLIHQRPTGCIHHRLDVDQSYVSGDHRKLNPRGPVLCSADECDVRRTVIVRPNSRFDIFVNPKHFNLSSLVLKLAPRLGTGSLEASRRSDMEAIPDHLRSTRWARVCMPSPRAASAVDQSFIFEMSGVERRSSDGAELGRFAQPDSGCGLCLRNRQPFARPDPAASRYCHGGTGEHNAAERAATAEIIDSSRSAICRTALLFLPWPRLWSCLFLPSPQQSPASGRGSPPPWVTTACGLATTEMGLPTAPSPSELE